MWLSARCLSVIKRLLCGKRMSHSTLHDFHYPVVIESLRIGTSTYVGGGGGGGFHSFTATQCYTSLVILAPQYHFLDMPAGIQGRICSLCAYDVGFSFWKHPQHKPEESTDLICLHKKECGSIGFVAFVKTKMGRSTAKCLISLVVAWCFFFFFLCGCSLESLFVSDMERSRMAGSTEGRNHTSETTE